jgi:two-component system response regulator HydG
MLLNDLVGREGYNVASASDGSEAIALIQKKKFDVALLDIQMPNTSGIEVLKYLQKNSPTTKAVILTGYANLKNAMEAKEFGAVDFISKPYRPDDVLSTIKRVLSQ